MVDGLEQRFVASQQRLVLDLEVLCQGHQHLLYSSPGQLVVEIDDVL